MTLDSLSARHTSTPLNVWKSTWTTPSRNALPSPRRKEASNRSCPDAKVSPRRGARSTVNGTVSVNCRLLALGWEWSSVDVMSARASAGDSRANKVAILYSALMGQPRNVVIEELWPELPHSLRSRCWRGFSRIVMRRWRERSYCDLSGGNATDVTIQPLPLRRRLHQVQVKLADPSALRVSHLEDDPVPYRYTGQVNHRPKDTFVVGNLSRHADHFHRVRFDDCLS